MRCTSVRMSYLIWKAKERCSEAIRKQSHQEIICPNALFAENSNWNWKYLAPCSNSHQLECNKIKMRLYSVFCWSIAAYSSTLSISSTARVMTVSSIRFLQIFVAFCACGSFAVSEGFAEKDSSQRIRGIGGKDPRHNAPHEAKAVPRVALLRPREKISSSYRLVTHRVGGHPQRRQRLGVLCAEKKSPSEKVSGMGGSIKCIVDNNQNVSNDSNAPTGAPLVKCFVDDKERNNSNDEGQLEEGDNWHPSRPIKESKGGIK